MKLEEQVLSIEQMQHLKELGVEVKDTAMAWFPPYKYDADGFPSYLFRDKDSYSVAFNDGDDAAIPTLTLQEILEMLPECSTSDDDNNDPDIKVIFIQLLSLLEKKNKSDISAESLKITYELLCWCAEHGYLNKE